MLKRQQINIVRCGCTIECYHRILCFARSYSSLLYSAPLSFLSGRAQSIPCIPGILQLSSPVLYCCCAVLPCAIAVPCCAVPCCAVPCCAVLCCAVLCCAVPSYRYAMLCCACYPRLTGEGQGCSRVHHHRQPQAGKRAGPEPTHHP